MRPRGFFYARWFPLCGDPLVIYAARRSYVGKFKATDQQATLVVDAFRTLCDMDVPAEIPPDAFCDTDDLPVLGTAVAGQVDCLVTGNKQLLELRNHQGISILSPRDFYNRIRVDE